MICVKGHVMAESVDTIAIERETIGHLLKEGRLAVPLSQRSYRWEKDHVEELLRDIHGALESGVELSARDGCSHGDYQSLVQLTLPVSRS